jgi:hypothetical protein
LDQVNNYVAQRAKVYRQITIEHGQGPVTDTFFKGADIANYDRLTKLIALLQVVAKQKRDSPTNSTYRKIWNETAKEYNATEKKDKRFTNGIPGEPMDIREFADDNAFNGFVFPVPDNFEYYWHAFQVPSTQGKKGVIGKTFIQKPEPIEQGDDEKTEPIGQMIAGIQDKISDIDDDPVEDAYGPSSTNRIITELQSGTVTNETWEIVKKVQRFLIREREHEQGHGLPGTKTYRDEDTKAVVKWFRVKFGSPDGWDETLPFLQPIPSKVGLQLEGAVPERERAPVQVKPVDPHPETKANPQPAMFEPSSDEEDRVIIGGNETHSTDSSTDDAIIQAAPAPQAQPQAQPAQPAPAAPPGPGYFQQVMNIFGGGPAQPAPAVVVPVPVVHAPVFGPMIGLREGRAWEKWKKRHHSKAVQAYIRNNQEQRFFKFNDHLNRIEPTYRREHIIRNVRVRGKLKREEIHRLRTHPLQDSYEDSKRAFEQKDPFSSSSKYAEAASIGEYIKLELMPAVIYIKILKHVQIPALRILARQLFAHCQRGETRIHLKQSRRTGKFNYGLWLSAKRLHTMSEEEFYQKLMGITKNGKRTVTLMVRQNIQKGSIHLLWENNHSLL